MSKENLDNKEMEISLKVADDSETITLVFESNERSIDIKFTLTDAQTLHFELGDAITQALLNKLNLTPPTGTRH